MKKGAFSFLLHAPLQMLMLFTVSAGAVASSIGEDFSTRVQRSSSTAIWNQGRGLLTPPSRVAAWDDGAAHNTTLDLGDGSHGAFSQSTWSRFATSIDTGAQIVYLDNTTYPTFQFTSFNVPAGWTIKASGNSALVILVQGDMVVDGIISCSGDNGTASTGTGATATAGLGGRGRCGGGAGGNGGSRYTGVGTGNGVAGSSPDALITGGNPGIISVGTVGSGGGGGGAWTSLNIPNHPATISGAGTRGTNNYDPAWNRYFGSAGGGGGSGHTTEAGGGGGGGGGMLDIHVGGNLTIGANGYIFASGGDGGSSPSAGGGGGAGGGGSVRTWVVGTMTLLGIDPPGAPVIEAISAQSGVEGTPATGGHGGSGYAGRTWVTVTNFVSDPTNPVTIGPSSQLTSEGQIEYLTSSNVEAESTAIDTGSTLATFNSANFVSSASGQVTLEFAGSVDGFASDNSGWVSNANIAQLNNKRFIKFRVTINNNSTTVPVTVDSISVDYTMGTKSDFDFKSSGCGLISPPPNPPSGFLFGLLLAFLALPLIAWKVTVTFSSGSASKD